MVGGIGRSTLTFPAGVHLLGDRIAIAPGCRIEPGAVIVGPAILDEGVQIRTGAYIRQNVVLAAGSLVGAHSEVKGSILLPGAKAPHQAYVGDSILGRDVNLGAGTICSNVKNIGREVSFRAGGETIHTGLRKFGAILGDGCKTGCNTVLNPGVLMGPGSVTYTNASVRSGYYPAGTLIKVRQTQQLTEMTLPRAEAWKVILILHFCSRIEAGPFKLPEARRSGLEARRA